MSPEYLSNSYSEGKAPLINSPEKQTESTSQIFIKMPLEDRSKYEKLTQYACVSSEDSLNEDNDSLKNSEKIRKKRRVKNIPEKLQSVYKNVELPIVKSLKDKNARNLDKKSKKKQINEQTDSVDVQSDDSIGSASDLRIDEETETNTSKIDAISETISESIRTCGSSAYHAECESMATHEEDATSRIIRNKLKEEAKTKGIQSEDMIFVGHQYGEKPLLLDDELDSDCEIKYDNYRWSEEKKNTNAELWVNNEHPLEDPKDVFALAPFHISKIKNKTPVSPTMYEKQKSETPNTSRQVSPSLTSMLLRISDIEHYNTNTIPKKTNDSFANQNVSLNPFLNNEFNVQVSQNISPFCVINNSVDPNSADPTLNNDNYFKSSAAFTTTNTFNKKTENYFADNEKKSIYENVEITFGKFENDFAKDETFCNETDSNAFFTSNFQLPTQYERTFQKADSVNDIKDFLGEEEVLESGYCNEDVDLSGHKHKKDRKKDGKSKYFLIDDRISDENPTVQKVGKPKGNTHKKVAKIKKSSKKIKSQAGFSNMSFEDFPSDDGEINQHIVRPFEVVRNADEKKYGSLKRKGNPFS